MVSPRSPVGVVVLVGITMAALRAADLAEEDAAFAPIPDRDGRRPVEHSIEEPHMMGITTTTWTVYPATHQVWTQALATGGSTERYDGLRVVHRRDAGIPDLQLSTGQHFDVISTPPQSDAGWGFSPLVAIIAGIAHAPAGPWQRFYLRGGSDSRSPRYTGFIAGGGTIAWTPWVGVHGDIGYSGTRALVLSGELQLAMLHAVVTRDRYADGQRIGGCLRFPGSANVWAGKLAIDHAWTKTHHVGPGIESSVEGTYAEATVQWSPWNRVVFSAQGTLSDRVIDDQGTHRGTGEISVGLAYGL